ncbi:hypothetical protein [Candidatus Scalindua japonica]|nr:hypothetical protein [Candidatus Scalindua japonica]
MENKLSATDCLTKKETRCLLYKKKGFKFPLDYISTLTSDIAFGFS